MSPLDQEKLREKVAELFIIRASGHPYDSQREFPSWEANNGDLKRFLNNGGGGVILLGGTVDEIKSRCKVLRKWSTKNILICADVEEGLGQRFLGGSKLPPPMSISLIYKRDPKKAIKLAEEYGKCIGDQARRCGLNWVLAPVCDINSNPNNSVINMRAWGEDPIVVSLLTSSFWKGLSSKGVLTCLKHFPGHGDSLIDSHLDLPVIHHDLIRLNQFELIPFKRLITEGANIIMTAHLKFINIDPNYPATLSKTIIHNLLRDSINFKGLLVTDALLMDSISKYYGPEESAVMAFDAGVDLIMMPQNIDLAINAVVNALRTGRIPIKRLSESLSRRQIEVNKVANCSFNSSIKLGQDEEISFQTNHEYSFSQKLVQESIEIRSPSRKIVKTNGINLIRIDNIFLRSNLKNFSPALSFPESIGFTNFIIHNLGVSPWSEDPQRPLLLDRFPEGSFFLQLFLRGNPFVGNSSYKEPWIDVIKQLQNERRLSGLVVYGSHYVWNELIAVLDSSLPAGYSPGQMDSAQLYILKSLFDPGYTDKLKFKQQISPFTD